MALFNTQVVDVELVRHPSKQIKKTAKKNLSSPETADTFDFVVF